MKVAREGWPLIALLIFMTIGSSIVSPPVSVFMVMFLGGVLWFFRDPERKGPEDPDLWVSPADGKVVEIERAEHPYVGPCIKVGIFMSVFDVHVNRFPMSGTVEFLEYVPGKKGLAFAPKASEQNERLYVGIRTPLGRAMMVQIAGLVARRIVCRVRKGDHLPRGERYGMIKLGSKVDLYLPWGVKVLVHIGEKVRAGVTPVGGGESLALKKTTEA